MSISGEEVTEIAETLGLWKEMFYNAKHYEAQQSAHSHCYEHAGVKQPKETALLSVQN